MIEIVELEWFDVFTANPYDVKSGLYSWHRVENVPDGYRSIYFKPDQPDALVDFLIQYNSKDRSPIFMVGPVIHGISPPEIALNPNGGYLATIFYSITKEQFISAMIESNHCCLDWLFFNADIWGV